jgi:hypothetical protein
MSSWHIVRIGRGNCPRLAEDCQGGEASQRWLCDSDNKRAGTHHCLFFLEKKRSNQTVKDISPCLPFSHNRGGSQSVISLLLVHRSRLFFQSIDGIC